MTSATAEWTDGLEQERVNEHEDISPLIIGLRAGDTEARRSFFERYWERPHREAFGVLRDRGDAHDVTAGLLLDFMTEGVHRFRAREHAALEHYLRVSARRRAIATRKHRQTLEPSTDQEAVGPTERDAWLLARLEHCLGELPPRTRAILRLKYAGGQDNAAIGRTLGQTRANISKLLTHSRKGALGKLRRCIESTRHKEA